MAASEYFAWAGAAVLFGVISFYQIFGRADSRYKYRKTFGLPSVTCGNGSEVIPRKVLFYAFGLATTSFIAATVLYAYGH